VLALQQEAVWQSSCLPHWVGFSLLTWKGKRRETFESACSAKASYYVNVKH
jgi:hypothetical protein